MRLGDVSTQASSWRRERKQQGDMLSELEKGNWVLTL